MLLSACSTYFRDLFKENPCQHPVIISRDVKFDDLVALVDFMYHGEVNVVREQLSSFLTTADSRSVTTPAKSVAPGTISFEEA
ncbi:longitudinals lacking protein-like [Bombus bifarius]|uniref:Longitudinals lacking protein-like n=2 Tax=Bombus bifarius TaxID=103933 RepID=A0A6P8N928_9HYME|nr:longitudinals lacking protein-like [Bombus bifarius]